MAERRNNSKQAERNNRKQPATPEREPHWTDISGEMRVFGEERKDGSLRYSTSIGVKNDAGEYDNMYFDVMFKKGEDPDIEGGFHINVEKGFLSFRKVNGKCYPRIVVTKYSEN